MNPEQHKHHDLIVAWAKGARIQLRSTLTNEWLDAGRNFVWLDRLEYRIKPEKVKYYVPVFRKKDTGTLCSTYPRRNKALTFNEGNSAWELRHWLEFEEEE